MSHARAAVHRAYWCRRWICTSRFRLRMSCQLSATFLLKGCALTEGDSQFSDQWCYPLEGNLLFLRSDVLHSGVFRAAPRFSPGWTSKTNKSVWPMGCELLCPGMPADCYTTEHHVCDHILESLADKTVLGHVFAFLSDLEENGEEDLIAEVYEVVFTRSSSRSSHAGHGF